mmetsp:Transcript_59203/g.162428  ORF Transcript_59203/g.162428 Transcript_59203/m.162428 type:complete len:240 (-) Transcript_59203:230-949(-)
MAQCRALHVVDAIEDAHPRRLARRRPPPGLLLARPRRDRPLCDGHRRAEPRVRALPLLVEHRPQRRRLVLGSAHTRLRCRQSRCALGLGRRRALRRRPLSLGRLCRLVLAQALHREQLALALDQRPAQPLGLRDVLLLQRDVGRELLHQAALRRMRLVQLTAQLLRARLQRLPLRLPLLVLVAPRIDGLLQLRLQRGHLGAERRRRLRRRLRLDLLGAPDAHRVIGEGVRPARAARARH